MFIAVRIAGGMGSWLVQWEIGLEREVKAKTNKVHHAKKLVLYSGSNGEPLKVLGTNVTPLERCPGYMGKTDWHRQGLT